MDEKKKFAVIEGDGRFVSACANELHERIMEAVYDYAGILPLVSAVGVIELAKIDLIEDQKA